jgi:serine protease
MTISKRARATTIAIAIGSLWLATAAAQDTGVLRAYRTLLSEVAAPAIDRGVRDHDAARPARAGKRERIARGARAQLAYLRGSVIVKFRPGTSPGARQAMLTLVQGAATVNLSYADFEIVAIEDDADPEAAVRRLSAQPDVMYAQARHLVHPTFVPNDPLYSRQWNYPAIDMERAWDINPGAVSEIVVAVLDSGVAYRNALLRFNAASWSVADGPVFPELGSVVVPFSAAPDLGADRFVAPRDFIWDDGMPLDLDGHGTHVAGTIAQATNNSVGVAGMAFNVRIMPVKVIAGLWDYVLGSPFEPTDDVVARGIRYAVDNGAKVINLSIGRDGPPAPVIRSAIVDAVSRGVFVTTSAGNGFLDQNPPERLAEFAAEIEGMVAVGAVGRDLRRAQYSTTGAHVELAAPGGDMNRDGTSGGILQQSFDFDLVETYVFGPARYRAPRFDVFAYQFLQGTSMASPHVAGFAALLIQQGITDPAAIEAVMKRYATDLGPVGRDDEYGYGLINPRAALRGMGLAK